MRSLIPLFAAVSAISTVRAAEVDFTKLAPHPRLFFPAKLAPADTPLLRDLDAALLRRGEKMLGQPNLARVLEGRRLLGVSRKAVERIVLLAYLHRTTGKAEFLQQAEKEMLAVAGFSDWHPEHFLDVAEMTAAMAIGYDWLFDALPPASRATIRDAIREKGLQAALGKQGTAASRTTNNWNPVCNGGITLGALAIAEYAPELAVQLVSRAIDGVPRAMAVYEPDGVYPEGPGYWEYGITYNILFIAALDSALGSDFGLAEKNGFRKTSMFLMQATGPSGLAFNFSDGGDRRPPSPAMFWFAKTLKNSEIAKSEESLLAATLAGSGKKFRVDRFDPFFRLWHPAALPGPAESPPLAWSGRGENPVAFLRTSWDPATAVYLGIKAGTASASHAHMDSGSFVLDAAGLRWAADPRSRNYNELETAGVKYWGNAQNSDRWKVWETGPFSHNTLTIDGQLHNATGHSKITEFSDRSAVLDLTETFKGQLTQATRTFTLAPDGDILIRDDLRGLKPDAKVRWAIYTPAAVEISTTSATLTQQGKSMTINFTATTPPALTIDPCDEDQRPFRRPMPGYRQLVATFPAAPDGTLTITTATTINPPDGK